MSNISDIAGFSVDASPIVSVNNPVTSIQINTNQPSVDILNVEVPGSVETIQVAVAGPQGPKGDQNVYVGSTPPDNPKIGWVWIQT